MTRPFLFEFSPPLQNENPQYYDVAVAIHKIKKSLQSYMGDGIYLFDVGDIEEDIDNILEEDIQFYPEQVIPVVSVFDCLETYTVSNKQQSNSSFYKVKPTLTNHVYYYPSFQVGYCNIPILQAHEDYPHTYLFATNTQAIEQFMEYIYKRQREVMQSYINIFVDTEEGVERKKEVANQMVQKDVFY
jgi:hypothetical protein